MDIIKNKLDKFISSNKLPHIIFHGESITDSIKQIHYLLSNLYINKKDERANTLYVNCAHGKGIKYIREHLKFFAKTNISINKDDTLVNRFKSVVLINADFLTIDAQSALRRCIELYSHTTRFFVVVLDKNTIINPILSRFCDIYVPNNNKIVYRTKIAKQFRDIKHRYLKKLINGIDCKNITYLGKNIFELSDDLYNRGFFYYDFIEAFNKNIVDDVVKYSLITYINKIRSEIKNEKILIMNILNIYCMRHMVEIENIYTF
jgi:DNA polymerase III delta prime subunit